MLDSKLRRLQEYTAELLSGEMPTIEWLPENRRDLDYQIKKALGQQGIVGIIHTPRAIFLGKTSASQISWDIDRLEIDVIENVLVNRGKPPSAEVITSQDACMRVFDTLCPLSGDLNGMFSPDMYEEGEDNGLLVGKCTLKTYLI